MKKIVLVLVISLLLSTQAMAARIVSDNTTQEIESCEFDNLSIPCSLNPHHGIDTDVASLALSSNTSGNKTVRARNCVQGGAWCSEWFDLENGLYKLEARTGPIHYKETYAGGESWLDIDATYSEPGLALDGSECLVYPRLPNITRVFTGKLGYEIQSRSNLGHIARVELNRINGIDVSNIGADDADLASFIKVHPYRVGVWKRFKRARLVPWVLRWKVTELGDGSLDTHRMQFRENPEAWSSADIGGLDPSALDALKVAITTARERIDDNSWYWYETIPRTAMLVDTDFTIATGSGDGYWYSTGSFNSSSNLLSIGSSASTDPASTFLHFPSITIPAGSTVNSAYLYVCSYSAYTTTVYSQIYLNDEDNPSAPTTHAGCDALTRTTEYASWTINTVWSQYSWYDTPSFVGAVQEVVDRAGWVANNNMLVLLIDSQPADSNVRNLFSYNEGNSRQAVFHLTWTEPSTGHPATKRMSGIPFARQLSQPGRSVW